MTPTTTTDAATDLYPSRTSSRPALIDRKDPVVWGGAADGPLDAARLADYERKGFLQLDGFFGEDELGPYRAELDRLRSGGADTGRPEVITEPGGEVVRSVFAVHEDNEILSRLCRDPRLVSIARQLLGGDVYIHQSRVNYKSGFTGKEFYWHSDFETWHVEDGMPRMRAVSCSVSLTENTPHNGPLLLIPGSHAKFLSCVGETPEN
ncbi:MAG TPA: phytanoyl-CoA dioxygenase family protein, partial [Thermoanaerobaculia bacterium]|nr:phytanoyl-CoA dioxygenase family protein [Thermoanaerobaculia bacterium]